MASDNSGAPRAGGVAQRSERSIGAWVPIVVLSAVGFSLGSDLYMLPALVPTIAGDLHLQVSIAAQMLTIYGALAAVAAPPLTILIRNVDRRSLLLTSMGLLVVTNLLTAATPNLPWLFATRVLAALAAAILTPIRTATAGQLAPGGARARAIGIATAGMSVALVVSAPFGLAAAELLGWRAAFVGASAVAAVALAGVLLTIPPVPAPGRSNVGEQLAILKDGRLLATLLSMVTAMCGIYVLLPFLVPVILHLTSFHGGAVALAFALYGIAGTVGNWSAGPAAERFGMIPVMLGGLALSAVSMVLLGLLLAAGGAAGANVMLPLVIVLWGWASWIYYALLFTRLIELAPQAAAAAISWTGPAAFAGISLGAFFGGLTLQALSMSWIGWVAAVLYLVAAVFVIASARTRSAAAAGGT